jgi:hypothetical protein
VIRSIDCARLGGDDAADGRAIAGADGPGHNTFFLRDARMAWGGGEIARGLDAEAAEVTMVSAMHSLR